MVQFDDADFHALDVTEPVSITLTIGELDDALNNLETYGLYLRAFNAETGAVEDEPEKELETVLCLSLTVGSDLEPTWTLISDRAKAQNATRNLTWSDRVRLAPARIGALAEFNLGWRRGSVLNRLTDEKADASAALAKAARDARGSFGDDAEKQLGETLRVVGEVAQELGIDVGDRVRALLDAHSITFSGGTISLHDEEGVPLRGLGTGSARLLIAGLQSRAAAQSPILLVDELEHGLEPHRIIRFLGSLGAKEKSPPLQVLMATHSPVALRELSGGQLWVVREREGQHEFLNVGSESDVQSAIRLYPDAFLASSVLVGEGASEVGLVRGLDQHSSANDQVSVFACGVGLVDCGGGEADKPFIRAAAFQRLGYRTALLRDDDTKPSEVVVKAFADLGGAIFSWRDGRTLEDELFLSLPDIAIGKMINAAIDLNGEAVVDGHIRAASQNGSNLRVVRTEIAAGPLSAQTRAVLGAAARTRKAGWFKSVSRMEAVARDIIAPQLAAADAGFREIVTSVFEWMRGG